MKNGNPQKTSARYFWTTITTEIEESQVHSNTLGGGGIFPLCAQYYHSLVPAGVPQ
jgi:hypothetical protein